MDARLDPYVGGATAQVAGHGVIDLRIARLRRALEQGRRRHDLASLAIAALRHVQLLPSLLQGMHGMRIEAFYRGYFFLAERRNRCETGAGRHTVDVHRACTALADAAAEFGADQIQAVAQGPQQWRIR